MIEKIAVAGAGTMGSGIALTAATCGYPVILFDNYPGVLDRAQKGIQSNLDFLLNKGKIDPKTSNSIFERIQFTDDYTLCKADLIIEAIVEVVDVKIELFKKLHAVNKPDTIFASNTSSLSITTLQEKIPFPERVAGMHFFNPAHIMKLVEVVSGKQTAPHITELLMDCCKKMNKVPVHCKDAPGFIVNRVARHYYLEAMKLVESGIANFESVDEIMEATGFKMGPFRLMDLIGMDINLAVSQSLYDAFDQELRFKPSAIQQDKVAKGNLGKKTGQGFYSY